MILYHGTPIKKGKAIIRDGKIKCQDIERHEGYENIIGGTTEGYVYLTKNLHTAFFYGNNWTIGERYVEDKYVYRFKMNIEDDCDLLEPDYVELNVMKIKYSQDITWMESLAKCGCVRIKKELCIEEMEYLQIPATANHREKQEDLEICWNLSKMQLDKTLVKQRLKQLEKEIEERWAWKKL